MATVGKILKARREELGFSLDDIHAKTKVGLKFLVSIENESYEFLPPESYTVGFIRLYAEAVGLDAGAIIAQYKRETKNGADISSTSGEDKLSDRDIVRKPISTWLFIAILAALAILAFGYYGWLRGTPETAKTGLTPNQSQSIGTSTAKP